jgi:hypothetical protein
VKGGRIADMEATMQACHENLNTFSHKFYAAETFKKEQKKQEPEQKKKEHEKKMEAMTLNSYIKLRSTLEDESLTRGIRVALEKIMADCEKELGATDTEDLDGECSP